MENMDNNIHQATLIEDLISAPFLAATHANSKMAQEQVKFILDSCFEFKDDMHTPKMITLKVKSSNTNQVEDDDNEITFELPIITIVPFNSLCVTDVNIKFDMEIVNTEYHKTDSSDNDNTQEEQIKMRGSLTTSIKKKNSSKSTLKVDIKGGTIPLPIGLTSILQLYSNQIHLSS